MKIKHILLFILLILFFSLMISPPNQNVTKQKVEKQKTPIIFEEKSIFIDGVGDWLGKRVEDVKQELGEPTRQYPGGYNCDWLSYSIENNILEVGISNGKVVSVFTGGEDANIIPFEFKGSKEKNSSMHPIKEKVTFTLNNERYEFNLDEKELDFRPLMISGNTVAQLYFDAPKDQLMAVRYMTKELLLMQKPYDLTYTGKLIQAQERRTEELGEVEAGSAYQIYLLSNFLRAENGLKRLELNNHLSEIAFFHSKDMKENNFFDHDSPTTGTLMDRLKRGEFTFRMAGENIAAHYIDGLDATMGWLNSPGHRVNLLSKEFQMIGIGVSGEYYTQDFATK